MCKVFYKYHILDHYNLDFINLIHFVFLDGQIGICRGIF
jgi:hypothetical protein